MNQVNLLRQTLKPLLGWHGARLNFLALFLIALLRVMISALKEACDRSINQGNLNRNYFAGLKENIKPPKRSKQLIEEEDYRAFTREERDIIIDTFKTSHKDSERQIANLVEFLFLTGCRLGEAFAFKWKDVKPEKGWIVFDESYSSETK